MKDMKDLKSSKFNYLKYFLSRNIKIFLDVMSLNFLLLHSDIFCDYSHKCQNERLP